MANALLHTFDQTSQDGFSDLLLNLEAAKRGEPRATDDVIGECLPQVSAYLSRRGSKDPDGLANSVMVEFLRNLHRLEFSSTRQMWSYINWISRSRLTDERRKSKPELLVTEAPEPAAQAQQGFDEHIVNQIWVTSMLAELTQEQREILELRFLNDLSIEDTANRTGKSQTAVKGLQRRAINALVAAASITAVIAAVVGSIFILSRDGGRTAVSSDPAATVPDDSHQSAQLEETDQRGFELGVPIDDLSQIDLENGGRSQVQPSSTTIAGHPGANPVAGPTVTTSPSPPTSDLGTGSPTTSPVSPTTTVSSSTTVGPAQPSVASPTIVPPTVSIQAEIEETVIYVGGYTTHVCLPTDPAGLADSCAAIVNDSSAGRLPELTVIAPADGTAVYAVNYVEPVCSAALLATATECEVSTVEIGSIPHGRKMSTIAGAFGTSDSTGILFKSTFYILDTVPAVCGGLPATIIGTSGPDRIIGTSGDDVIAALGGDDDVSGAEGDDLICLGAGNDLAEGGAGSDTIYGGEGDDDVYGDALGDTLYGGPGDDYIRGNGGDDTIFGGEGTDDIVGGGGTNTIYHGEDLGGEPGPDGAPGAPGSPGTIPEDDPVVPEGDTPTDSGEEYNEIAD